MISDRLIQSIRAIDCTIDFSDRKLTREKEITMISDHFNNTNDLGNRVGNGLYHRFQRSMIDKRERRTEAGWNFVHYGVP